MQNISSSHEHPERIKSLSVDCVIFGFHNLKMWVLLTKRKIMPCYSWWALPGGFVRNNENLRESSKRVLFERTGLSNLYLEQFKAFGKVDRYPNERVITIVYYALVNPENYSLNPGPDSLDAKWYPLEQIFGNSQIDNNRKKLLPFDHWSILSKTFKFLQQIFLQKPIGFELLPTKFTLTQLQTLYEVIFDVEVDKSNFRKKFQKMGLLETHELFHKNVPHRAPRLYSFDKEKFDELMPNWMNFDFGITSLSNKNKYPFLV